ncbi:MAG: NAD-dependent epimerase/dehydratase family protein [Myxococcota bacterium]|nr:NAD-dependent epimerase/dehydratase family protein [Myxococcota bacterium]
MKFFITGGSGFIGREFLQHLAARGHSARALARSEKAQQQTGRETRPRQPEHRPGLERHLAGPFGSAVCSSSAQPTVKRPPVSLAGAAPRRDG